MTADEARSLTGAAVVRLTGLIEARRQRSLDDSTRTSRADAGVVKCVSALRDAVTRGHRQVTVGLHIDEEPVLVSSRLESRGFVVVPHETFMTPEGRVVVILIRW